MDKRSGKWFRSHVPKQFANPAALAARLLFSSNPAARFAVASAGLGLLLSPFDFLLSRFERQLYQSAKIPEQPIILVGGPPRSGTTLVAHTLIQHFDVAYINNLTSLFPRSPIIANKLFGRFFSERIENTDVFYGKSTGMAGINDGLYLWDRWLGSDRSVVPTRLRCGTMGTVDQFFGALQAFYGKPVVNKANILNTCANLVAEALPDARFVLLRRDPIWLAQSLYVARQDIVGNMSVAYGVCHEDRCQADPVEDVCRQVLFHEAQTTRQLELIGHERLMILPYEKFCQDPTGFLRLVEDKWPGISQRGAQPRAIQPFTVSRRRKLPDKVIDRFASRLAVIDNP